MDDQCSCNYPFQIDAANATCIKCDGGKIIENTCQCNEGFLFDEKSSECTQCENGFLVDGLCTCQKDSQLNPMKNSCFECKKGTVNDLGECICESGRVTKRLNLQISFKILIFKVLLVLISLERNKIIPIS